MRMCNRCWKDLPTSKFAKGERACKACVRRRKPDEYKSQRLNIPGAKCEVKNRHRGYADAPVGSNSWHARVASFRVRCGLPVRD